MLVRSNRARIYDDAPFGVYCRVIGENLDITAKADIWPGGGLWPGWDVTTDDQFSLVSDSADDTLLGTGAAVVEVQGLSFDLAPMSELIEMDGVTPVLSTMPYLRVTNVRVVSAGAGGENAGTITGSIGASNVTVIAPGDNNSMVAAYTVPIGKCAHMESAWFQCTANDEMRWELVYRNPGGVWLPIHHGVQFRQPAEVVLHGWSPDMMGPGTDVALRAERLIGTGTALANGGFSLVEV